MIQVTRNEARWCYMIKKLTVIILSCFLLLSLSGCDSDQGGDEDIDDTTEETTKVIHEGDYSAQLPFRASDARAKHGQSSSLLDSFNICSGLMELSKEYFSSDTHSYKESQFITYDILDASDLSTGLLGRTNSESNPIGLNPEVDTPFELKSETTKNITATDVLLYDIYELDWYKSKELEGISLAIMLNDQIGDSDNPDTLSESALLTYGKEVGVKVVDYLRTNYPEIGSNLPIYVALYRVNGSNTTLPGSYFAASYFKSKTLAQFTNIKESWKLFPSSAATEDDPSIADNFDSFANDVKTYFSEDVSIIGKGHYRDDSIVNLRIDINMYAKSGAEIKAAIQLINSKLSLFTSTTYDIRVNVLCDTKETAVIARLKGSSDTNVISLIE